MTLPLGITMQCLTSCHDVTSAAWWGWLVEARAAHIAVPATGKHQSSADV